MSDSRIYKKFLKLKPPPKSIYPIQQVIKPAAREGIVSLCSLDSTSFLAGDASGLLRCWDWPAACSDLSLSSQESYDDTPVNLSSELQLDSSINSLTRYNASTIVAGAGHQIICINMKTQQKGGTTSDGSTTTATSTMTPATSITQTRPVLATCTFNRGLFASTDTHVTQWDMERGPHSEPIRISKTDVSELTCLAPCHRGGVLVAGTASGHLLVLDPRAPDPSWWGGHRGERVTALADTGGAVVSAASDGRLSSWDLRQIGGQATSSIVTSSPSLCLATAPCQSTSGDRMRPVRFASGQVAHQTKLYDVDTLESVGVCRWGRDQADQRFPKQCLPVTSLCWLGSDRLVTGGWDRGIFIFHIE
eukprot:gnl/Dysnectes_brevis/482_a535_3648.p1 GENE.gnl/Dysnectes_brevis/482_a535_3648~~gnl/Dysnectes_brevis/482_a535_3648.p1  ORF type:complete len:363 (+),score=77.20 gnl/Dysnectes_brevis/482_a535_3648:517-1605(+)